MEISILGMHRSGTSMVSRLLNLCGVDLGSEDNLMGANPDDNAAGYWEHESVVAINDDILQQLGGSWGHVPSVKPGWSKDKIFDPIRERIASVIHSFDYASVWGWKDPRTTITLELWRDALPALKLVVCIRHPMEVALSLSRANVKTRVMPYDDGLKLWSAYYTRLFEVISPEDAVFTHYHTYFYNADAELRRVLGQLDLHPSEEYIQNALYSIQSDLSHYKMPDFMLQATYVPEKFIQQYDMLCDLTGDVFRQMTEDETYQEQAIQTYIIKSFEDARSSRLELIKKYREIESKQDEVRASRHEVRASRHEVRARDQEIERQRQVIDNKQNQIENKQRKIESKQNQVEQKQLEIDNKQLQVENKQREVEYLQQQLATRDTQIQELQSQLTRSDENYHAVVEKMDARIHQLISTDAALQHNIQSLWNLHDQLQNLQQILANRDELIMQLNAKIDLYRTHLERASRYTEQLEKKQLEN